MAARFLDSPIARIPRFPDSPILRFPDSQISDCRLPIPDCRLLPSSSRAGGRRGGREDGYDLARFLEQRTDLGDAHEAAVAQVLEPVRRLDIAISGFAAHGLFT